jgi:hypothetical protein
MVVLDVRSGKLQWFGQFVPHDQHDWDLTVTNPLYSTVIGDARRPVRWPCHGRCYYLCSCWQAVRWSDVWRRHQVLEDSTSIIDSDHFLITVGEGPRSPF